MFSYYCGLAIRSIRKNAKLTSLAILAIGVGIGSSMAMQSIFRAMSADPLPGKSRQLYTVQLDNCGPLCRGNQQTPDMLTYRDVTALMSLRAASSQTATYGSQQIVAAMGAQAQPMSVAVRAATTDFFSMFAVPFLHGSPWSVHDDAARTPLAVLSEDLNDRLFAGANSVGKTFSLGGSIYQVIGVLAEWQPSPRFYDLGNDNFAATAQVFVPLSRAIEQQMAPDMLGCDRPRLPGWRGMLGSECYWLSMWVQLPTPSARQNFSQVLRNYALTQKQMGRFSWVPSVQIYDIPDWLKVRGVVPESVRALGLVGVSVLLICLLHAAGMILSIFLRRTSSLGVRRALGASRRAIFAQCLVETGLIGSLGAVIGLAFMALGLFAARSMLAEPLRALAALRPSEVGLAVLAALFATVLAGLYPSWRASLVQPAVQLKVQ